MDKRLRWKDIYELAKEIIDRKGASQLSMGWADADIDPQLTIDGHRSKDIIRINIRDDVIIIMGHNSGAFIRTVNGIQYTVKFSTHAWIDVKSIGHINAGVIFAFYQLKYREYFNPREESKKANIEIDEEAYAENHDDHFLKNLSDNHPDLKWLQRAAALDESRKETEEDHRVLLDAENIVEKTECSSVSPNFKKIVVKEPEVHNYHYILDPAKVEDIFDKLMRVIWYETESSVTFDEFKETSMVSRVKEAMLDVIQEEIC